MKTPKSILDTVESSIVNKKEKEYFSIHSARYNFILNLIYRLSIQPSGAKALDIGCFPPHLFNSFKSLGYDMYGVSSEHEKYTDKNVISINIENNILPFPDNFFNLIVFSEVLEHLFGHPAKLLSEINRILKPGGTFVVTTPNVLRTQNLFNLILGNNIYFDLNQLKDSDVSTGSIYYRHNREYSMSEITALLSDAQFKIKEKGFFISYVPYRKKNRQDKIFLKIVKYLNYILMLILPGRRDTLFVVSTK